MELLDGNDIPFADISRNMDELAFINRHLGGHRITISGIKQLMSKSDGLIHIAEVGCGGGDNLKAIQKWAERNNVNVRLTGVDINENCIRHARATQSGIHFIHSDYRHVTFPVKPDILFASLFAHHLADDDLVDLIKWMHLHSTRGFVVNDLHRHPLAYYSIRVLTSVFSRSYLVKHDAPISVLRGFSQSEWRRYFQKAGVPLTICQWHWAFRWLIVSSHYEHPPAY